jgi:hypothetical protein
MTLVDTSVWVDHLRAGNPRLQALLRGEQVLIHPFVVGELSCGNLRNRERLLRLLAALPEARQAQHQEVLDLVEKQHLSGLGLGWIDAHLLASALLSRTSLWTLDRQLATTAARLGVCA